MLVIHHLCLCVFRFIELLSLHLWSFGSSLAAFISVSNTIMYESTSPFFIEEFPSLQVSVMRYHNKAITCQTKKTTIQEILDFCNKSLNMINAAVSCHISHRKNLNTIVINSKAPASIQICIPGPCRQKIFFCGWVFPF